jgi:sugar diacid utilization regulator
LAGGAVSEIAELASRHLSRPVVILDRRLEVEGRFPPDLKFEALSPEVKAEILKKAPDSRALVRETTDAPFYCQRIVVDSELLGWALTPGPPSASGEVQLALGEICGALALHRMKERAASRALSDKLSSLLWDMIDAPDDVRRIACARARDLGVDLNSESAVIVCWFDEVSRRGGQDQENDQRGSWRQYLAQLPARLVSSNRAVKLCTLRGDELVLVAAVTPGTEPRAFAEGLCGDLDRAVPGTIVRIGVSRRIDSPGAIPAACKDARIALAVTRQAGQKRILSIEEIGVAGLLMSMRDGADFKSFVFEKIHGLLDEKSPQRDALLETLRAYFASNCSQQATAKRLRVHQKTVAYRLDKIQRITGLNLETHEARVLLDLAVRMNDLLV